jgi:hypothetical protein
VGTLTRGVVIVLALAAVGFLSLGIVCWRRVRAFRRSAVRAEATVVGFRTRKDSEGSLLYFPIVRFRDQSGREHEVCSDTGQSPAGFVEGATAVVLYDPSNPAKARIDSFWQMWFGPACLFFCGGVCAAVAATWLLVTALLAVHA